MTYRFGEFELRPESYRLTRAGEPIHAEPKVLELLTVLVENADRMVLRQDLLDAVWAGEYVGDAALARAVHELRKLLGEDAKSPRHIHTVHGRGYRFAGPVETVADAPEMAPAGAPRPLSADGGSPAAPERRPAPRRLPWLLAAAFALTLVVGVFIDRGAAPPPGPIEPTPASESAVVVLGGIGRDSTGTIEDLTAMSVIDLLYHGLSRVPGLTVRSPEYGRQASLEADSLSALAETAGADFVLTGRWSRPHPADGGRPLEVALQLHDTRGAERVRTIPLGTYGLPLLEDGENLDPFLSLRDAVAARVIELARPLLAIDPSEDDALSPKDPEAYRLYLLGYQAHLRDFCDGGGGRELLERSLDIDAGFAPAWLYLAVSHFSQVWACGRSVEAYGPALAAVSRALELAPEYDHARTLEMGILLETNRVAEAWEAVDERLRERPNSPHLLSAASVCLRYAGFLRASADLVDRVLELDPLIYAVGTPGGSPAPYLYQGRHDAFLAALPAGDSPYFLYFRGYVALLEGEPKRARTLLQPAFALGPGTIFGRLSHALMSLAEDDRQQALAILELVGRQRRQLGAADGEITYKEAQLTALAGAPRKALEDLAHTVEQGFFCGQCFDLDPALASVRGLPGYRTVRSEARRRHLEFAARAGLEPEDEDVSSL